MSASLALNDDTTYYIIIYVGGISTTFSLISILDKKNLVEAASGFFTAHLGFDGSRNFKTTNQSVYVAKTKVSR